ncbi:DUF1189 family protein [Neobacillus sp. D3-1R]|uniref:DUF1189 family protein n=1 Tax=Neobacillus sp. D3-1R TaxID=3445778 RepID=UPI003F9F901C
MNLFDLFKNCLSLPKREAVLRLNKVEMKTTFYYFFLLMLVWIFPMELKLFFENKSDSVSPVLILYPFFMMFYALIGISLFTLLGWGLSKLFQRKLRFPLLWKMTTFSLTIPIIFWTISNLMIENNKIVNVIVIVMILFYMVKMILVYPKRKIS